MFALEGIAERVRVWYICSNSRWCLGKSGYRYMCTEAWVDRPMIELNLRGSVCPGPTSDTLLALKKLPPGGKLVVTTDYLPARQTIPRLVEERGCSWRMTEDDGKTFRLEITKGDG
jgi:TusA-related sulfurtransferase